MSRYKVESYDDKWAIICDGKPISNSPSGSAWLTEANAKRVCESLNSAYAAGLAERPPSAPPKPVTPVIDFKYPGYLDGCRDPEGKHDDEYAKDYLQNAGRFFVKRCPCPQCDRRRARKMELRVMDEDKAQAKHDRKYRPKVDKPFLRPRSIFWNCVNGMALGVVIAWYAFILPSQDELNKDNAALRARVEQMAEPQVYGPKLARSDK